MDVIVAHTPDSALWQGMNRLKTQRVTRESRNGRVYVMPCPITTVYMAPQRKVLFCPARDANPFFHLFEALWMLGGRNDVNSVARYVKRMKEFSDNGITLQGAYGHRWRHHFGYDQLEVIIKALREDYDDRRNVLSMWDGRSDLGLKSKDLPCNTHAYFTIDDSGKLDMTICNRSNDIIWGAYGANLVHMSFLMEYVAAGVGVPMGRYFQMSNNFHAYANVFDPLYEKLGNWLHADALQYPEMMPLVRYPPQFDFELAKFLDSSATGGFEEPFLQHVAVPMREVHRAWKRHDGDDVVHWLGKIAAPDWARAAAQWIGSRC